MVQDHCKWEPTLLHEEQMGRGITEAFVACHLATRQIGHGQRVERMLTHSKSSLLRKWKLATAVRLDGRTTDPERHHPADWYTPVLP